MCMDPQHLGKALSFVFIPCLSCIFVERGEAAGADPGGAHQSGGRPEELLGQFYLQAGE